MTSIVKTIFSLDFFVQCFLYFYSLLCPVFSTVLSPQFYKIEKAFKASLWNFITLFSLKPDQETVIDV